MEEKINITFTALPSRKDGLAKMVKSLLSQNMDNFGIQAWLPEKCNRTGNKFGKIPDILLDDPRIAVHMVKDMGSITKMYYQAKQEGGPFVLCDDDVVYPQGWLKAMYSTYRKFEGKKAICMRGRVFTDKTPNYKKTRLVRCDKLKVPSEVDIMTGTWGCMMNSDMLGEYFFQYENHMQLFKGIDDIWITGCLRKNGTQILAVPHSGIPKPLHTHDINSLWKGNRDGRNNNKGIDFFGKELWQR